MKEAQALHVRSEMAALATEAKALMDVDPWLAPEPPHPPGGTRLPHLFGALAHQRMTDLVRNPGLAPKRKRSIHQSNVMRVLGIKRLDLGPTSVPLKFDLIGHGFTHFFGYPILPSLGGSLESDYLGSQSNLVIWHTLALYFQLISGGASTSRGVERRRGHPWTERCGTVLTQLCDGERVCMPEFGTGVKAACSSCCGNS